MPARTSLRYRIVDVFTEVPLEGNALAVFPGPLTLSDVTMQQIARELNLSETVFFFPSQLPGCAAALRIFTPTREMRFAGHPTVGAAWVIRKERLIDDAVMNFAVEEQVGPVSIRVERGPGRIWLTTPPIEFGRCFEPEPCARMLGLSAADLLPVAPQIASAGNPTLFIAVKNQEGVDRCCLDAAAFRTVVGNSTLPLCVFVFAPSPAGAYSRMFAPEYGIIEDPATGSSTGPLASYMIRHNLLPSSKVEPFISEQGTKMGRRSLIFFDPFSPAASDGIPVGGHVTPVAEGVFVI